MATPNRSPEVPREFSPQERPAENAQDIIREKVAVMDRTGADLAALAEKIALANPAAKIERRMDA